MPRARKEEETTVVEENHDAPDVELAQDAEEVPATDEGEPAVEFYLYGEDERLTREANRDFIKAQAALGNVAKDAKGNYGKFLSLPKLLEAVRYALNENNLFLTQETTFLMGEYVVTTRITHVNGMIVADSTYPIQTADKTNPQKMGSGLTYARRYALMSLVGVGAEDDEGELAKQPAAKQPAAKQPAAKNQVLRRLSELGVKTAEDFQALAKEAGISAKSSQELTEEQSAIWLNKLYPGKPTPF